VRIKKSLLMNTRLAKAASHKSSLLTKNISKKIGAESMIPHFSSDVRSLLLTMPTYTPALLATGELLSLVLRVDTLQPFRKHYPITLRFSAWCAPSGTWVCALAFRVADSPTSPLEGDSYLNPRQQGDWENLERLAQQEQFPLIFCNATLTEAVGKAIPWPPSQRAEIQAALELIAPAVPGKIAGSSDPEFQQAKEAFQEAFSVSALLALPR
jgi:hypothetical protein